MKGKEKDKGGLILTNGHDLHQRNMSGIERASGAALLVVYFGLRYNSQKARNGSYHSELFLEAIDHRKISFDSRRHVLLNVFQIA